MTWYSSVRRIEVWGLVMVMLLLLATGCAQRSLHGVHQHGKKTGKPTAIASQRNFSPDTMSKERKQKLNDLTPAGEGYFSEGSEHIPDMLKGDPVVREDQLFESGSGNFPGSSNDYWMNRTRAEQLTAQSGLQDVHFEFNSFQLDEMAKATLSTNAEWLKAHPHAEVTIEGHCDDRGTASYNHILGEKRAMRTKKFLTGLGISPERLHVMSYGKENPVCWDSTESCYQKNRRAHLVLDISVASTALPYAGGPIE